MTFTSQASIIELRRNKKVERNVLNEIETGYAQFTKKQKKLADFMRENIHSIPFLSIVELGEKTEVSPASITRFTRELGYNGYAEFQKSVSDLVRRDVVPMRELKSSITSDGEEDILEGMIERNVDSLRKLYGEGLKESLYEASELVGTGRRVYITAARSSFCVAYYLYFMLKEFMDCVELLSEGLGDISNKLQFITPEDVLIAVSYERYTRATYNIVSYLNEAGSKIIAITDSYSSPIALKADCVLLARQAPDTYSFVNAMTVANALIAAVGRRDRERSLERMKRQDEIAIEYGLYL